MCPVGGIGIRERLKIASLWDMSSSLIPGTKNDLRIFFYFIALNTQSQNLDFVDDWDDDRSVAGGVEEDVGDVFFDFLF